jgi:hypothetical protein
LVAVAVTKEVGGTATLRTKAALPATSVATSTAPRKLAPSPKPEGSAAALEKTSMR